MTSPLPAPPSTTTGRLRRSLISIEPGLGAWRPAIRAASATAIVAAGVVAVGHPEWLPFAAFGAFSAIFGRGLTRRDRQLMEAEAGVSLVISIALGVVTGSILSPWGTVAVGGALTFAVAGIAGRRRWRPPGALFQLFGFSASAAHPTVHLTDLLPAVLVSIAAVLISIAVGTWPTSEAPAITASPPPLRPWPSYWQYPVVTAGAGWVALALDFPHPFWAMISAVVLLVAPDPVSQIARGIHRVGGTAIGIILAALLLSASGGQFLIMIMLVPVLQFCVELFIARNYGIALIFLTPVPILLTRAGGATNVSELLVGRLTTALVGVIIALVVLGIEILLRSTRRPTSAYRS